MEHRSALNRLPVFKPTVLLPGPSPDHWLWEPAIDGHTWDVKFQSEYTEWVLVTVSLVLEAAKDRHRSKKAKISC